METQVGEWENNYLLQYYLLFLIIIGTVAVP